MKKIALIILALAWLASFPSAAEEIIMARVPRPFPEAMNALQESIRTHGYAISRVQRVDVGLTTSGFQTAEYRLVFFGKEQEIRSLPDKAPTLIPYLPLNFVIYAEGDEALVLITNPAKLAEFVGHGDLQETFRRWERDIRAIVHDLTTLPD